MCQWWKGASHCLREVWLEFSTCLSCPFFEYLKDWDKWWTAVDGTAGRGQRILISKLRFHHWRTRSLSRQSLVFTNFCVLCCICYCILHMIFHMPLLFLLLDMNFNCSLLTHFLTVFLQILYIVPHICWLGAHQSTRSNFLNLKMWFLALPMKELVLIEQLS